MHHAFLFRNKINKSFTIAGSCCETKPQQRGMNLPNNLHQIIHLPSARHTTDKIANSSSGLNSIVNGYLGDSQPSSVNVISIVWQLQTDFDPVLLNWPPTNSNRTPPCSAGRDHHVNKPHRKCDSQLSRERRSAKNRTKTHSSRQLTFCSRMSSLPWSHTSLHPPKVRMPQRFSKGLACHSSNLVLLST